MPRFILIFFSIFLLLTPARGFANTSANLQQCFEWALKRSETVAIQEQNIVQVEAQFSQAVGAVLPKISAKGTESLQDDSASDTSGSSVGSTFTRFSRPEVKINAKQPIFSGLREFHAMKALRATRRAESSKLEATRKALFLDLARTFYAHLQLKEEFHAAVSIRSALEKRLSLMQRRVQLGQSRESELLSTESELALAKAGESIATGQFANAKEVLYFFTGHHVDSLIDDIGFPSSLPPADKWITQLRRRPDLQSAQAQKQAAQSNWSAEKGLRYPTLNAEANYYPYRVGFQKDIKWDALFSLEIPLFRGGEAYGKIREARAESRQADLAYEEAEKKAEMDAKQSYNNFIASKKRMESLELAQSKGEINYYLVEKEYQQGVTNNLEVLTTLKQWQELKKQYWQAYAQAKVDWWSLKIAMGESIP